MNLRSLVVLLCVVLIAVTAAASPVVKFTLAALAVYSITPAEGFAGSNGTYHISGSGLMNGAHVYLKSYSTQIDATDDIPISYWGLQCTINIPPQCRSR